MNIKAKRIERGLLQKDILKDTGLLSKIENGKAIACPQDIERFAKIFECEPRELFTSEETAYFGDKFGNGKTASSKIKKANNAVCKPVKKRKCFWLDRKTDEVFADAIKALGFSTSQEWFESAVEETIKQTSPEITEKIYVNSDIMGREEIYQ